MYKLGKWNRNKPLCKKCKNIDGNKTGKFGVTKVKIMISGSVHEKKLILRKWPLKVLIETEIYKHKYTKYNKIDFFNKHCVLDISFLKKKAMKAN